MCTRGTALPVYPRSEHDRVVYRLRLGVLPIQPVDINGPPEVDQTGDQNVSAPMTGTSPLSKSVKNVRLPSIGTPLCA